MVTERSGDVIARIKETIAHGAHAIDVEDVQQLIELIGSFRVGFVAGARAEILNSQTATGEYNNG